MSHRPDEPALKYRKEKLRGSDLGRSARDVICKPRACGTPPPLWA
jgi:hypothetical protein